MINWEAHACLPLHPQADFGPIEQFHAAGVNYVSPAQVPGWQPAYATTVHKAQGSQAEHVVVMLPDVISRLCTREGLYTGITRAKSVVRVIGPREVFDACVARVTERTSLLPEMLRG